MTRRPSINQLRVFLAAADCGTFSGAARSAHKTQASVSMQIRMLEEIINSKLFSRGARQLKLTSSGETLYVYAKKMISLEEEAWAAMQNRANASLRIGAPDIYVQKFLPEVIGKFHAAHPDVRIEVVCAPTVRLSTLIINGRIDAAIGVKGRNFDGNKLFRQPVKWVARDDTSSALRNAEE